MMKINNNEILLIIQTLTIALDLPEKESNLRYSIASV